MEPLTLFVIFDDFDPTANAIDQLHEMGIADEKINIVSGIPFKHEILGRPNVSTIVPRLALGGAMVGLIVALFLIFGIPKLFPINVGDQPLLPFPPFFIIGFEMTMLGLMGTAFVGLFIAGRLPTYEPKAYIPEISDGKIAVVFPCPLEMQDKITEVMKSMGAEQIRPVEAKPL
jgi:hypothetical protein